MAYCTQAELEDEVGGPAKLLALADRDASGAIDTGAVDRVIAEADRWIDSYAHKRHAVPLTSTHAAGAIQQVSVRKAGRALRRKRGMVLASDITDEATDQKWLEDLAKGLVSLGIEPGPEPSELVTDVAGERATTKNVSRERMKGFW